MIEPDRPVADLLHLTHVMRDEDDGATLGPEAVDPLDTFALKRRVADRQNLINQQDTRADMDGGRETKPQAHPGAVGSHGLVDKGRKLGKGHDLIEPIPHLGSQKPGQYAADEDILPPRQVEMHPGVEVEKPVDRRPRHDPPFIGPHDAAQKPEKGGFPRPVMADNTQHLARRDLETDIAQRPEPFARPRASPAALDKTAQGHRMAPAMQERLAQPLGPQDRRHQISSRKRSLERRKNRSVSARRIRARTKTAATAPQSGQRPSISTAR